MMASNYTYSQSALQTCKHHPINEYDSYCFTCKKRICEECCRDYHKDHNWKRSRTAAKEIKATSCNRCVKLKEMINGLEEDKEEEQADIKRIDMVKTKYKSLIDEMAERMKAKRREGWSIRDMDTRMKKLKEILIFFETDIYSEEHDILQENISYGDKTPKFKEGTLALNALQKMFGDVVKDITGSMAKVTEKSHFTLVDDSTYILIIVPVTYEEALVRRYNSSQIDTVDNTGKVVKKRKLPKICSDFIMRDSDIIFTSFKNKMVCRISSSGTVSYVHSTAPLHPQGITTSQDGGILVTLIDCPLNEITALSRGHILHIDDMGKVKRRYDFTDIHKDRFIVYPFRVAQNINMDICIVDIIDKDYRSRLVVLSVTSLLKFIYTGQSTLKEKFESDDVACDHVGRILVTDYLNDAVHLLREDGHILGLLLTQESPLYRPRCLGLHANTLWVGCEKGVVRVYKYNED